MILWRKSTSLYVILLTDTFILEYNLYTQTSVQASIDSPNLLKLMLGLLQPVFFSSPKLNIGIVTMSLVYVIVKNMIRTHYLIYPFIVFPIITS